MKILIFTFLTIAYTYQGFSQTGEEIAIIKLLEKESATWRSGDIEGHASCWTIKPYSRILVSTADGNVIDVPPVYMISPPEGMAGNGGTSINSNYVFSISDTTAWVSHDEVSYTIDGKETKSIEIRMLEKINGEWKLVGQSIHIQKPK